MFGTLEWIQTKRPSELVSKTPFEDLKDSDPSDDGENDHFVGFCNPSTCFDTPSPVPHMISFRNFFLAGALFAGLIFFSSCNTTGPDPEEILVETGIASWYGEDYPARCTANGETYDRDALTAAHKELPFNTIIRVLNTENGKSVVVRINDRGPFVEGRVVDLSRRAAAAVDILTAGLAEVELYLVEESDNPEPDFSRGCLEL